MFVAEVGADMTRFPTAGHLGAWSGLAPASHESAGKRRPAGTRHGAPWLGRAMVEAARAAARTKNSYYPAKYARIAKRRGPNKAAVAVAHSMITTIWHLLTNGQLYDDPGADFFARRHDPAATIPPSKRSDSHDGSRPSDTTSASPKSSLTQEAA